MAFLGDLIGRWFQKTQRSRRSPQPSRSNAAWKKASRPGVISSGREPGGQNFPSFLASAIDRPIATGEHRELLHARLALRDTFTPSQPVTDRNCFAGRLNTLIKLIEILEEQRSHVVVYGERGIGKTSLMHILADVARDSRYLVGYASCGAHSGFEEIFRAVLSNIPMLYLSSVAPTDAEAEGKKSLASRLPEHFNARFLGDLCSEIVGTRIIIILDEYDRIQDPEFRQSVAELIKNLSDRAARVQIVLAGVASNLQELIGYIPSIRRNVIGMPVPRLTAQEVTALINIGERAAGVRFEDKLIRAIAVLSNGSPYLTRLLSHHISMHGLDAGRLEIGMTDLSPALDKVVEEAESRLSPATARGVLRSTSDERLAVVGAIARAAVTPDGWFTEEDVIHYFPNTGPGMSWGRELENLAANDDAMLDVDRTAQLPRYRFRDEALPTYLSMKIARDFVRQGYKVEDIPLFDSPSAAD